MPRPGIWKPISDPARNFTGSGLPASAPVVWQPVQSMIPTRYLPRSAGDSARAPVAPRRAAVSTASAARCAILFMFAFTVLSLHSATRHPSRGGEPQELAHCRCAGYRPVAFRSDFATAGLSFRLFRLAVPGESGRTGRATDDSVRAMFGAEVASRLPGIARYDEVLIYPRVFPCVIK